MGAYVPPLQRRHAVVVVLAAVGGLLPSLACDQTPKATQDWRSPADSADTYQLSEEPCEDCIRLAEVATVGDNAGPGFVNETQFATRDSVGRYWFGQMGMIKVFDEAGVFVQEVGRPGEGPMEFGMPGPMYTDADGFVHIVDLERTRTTIVGPDFELHGEERLPGFVLAAAPIPGSDRMVINAEMLTPDQLGLPLHVISRDDVVVSFGVPDEAGVLPLTRYQYQRLVTADSDGYLYSAKLFDYSLEVWTRTGRRLRGFEGPELNETPPLSGPWSRANPPANRLLAIRKESDDRLWVVSHRVREDWLHGVREHVASNGSVILQPRESLASVYQTRIELVDIAKSAIVASHRLDGIVDTFLGDHLILGTRYSPEGIPTLIVWSIDVVTPLER